jgi:hypothetical protein
MSDAQEPDEDGHERGGESPPASPSQPGPQPPQAQPTPDAYNQQVQENRERYIYGPTKTAVKWLDAHNAGVMAVATVVIMIATIANVWVVGGQLEEMRSSGRQTDQLIKSNADLAAAAGTQAEATKQAADVAERTLLITQIPYVGIQSIKEVPTRDAESKRVIYHKVSIVLENTGNTVAKNMATVINGGDFIGEIPGNFAFSDGGVTRKLNDMAPKSPLVLGGIPLEQEAVIKIAAHQIHYYFWGWVEYDDLFMTSYKTPRHGRNFCFELVVNGDPSEDKYAAEFLLCPKHNEEYEKERNG